MDKNLAQMLALLQDVRGYADAFQREAQATADRSALYAPTAAKLDALEQVVEDKQAELNELENKLKAAREQHARLLEILQRV
jgi:DNA repair exonuclease SbcCD ATPase subunit